MYRTQIKDELYKEISKTTTKKGNVRYTIMWDKEPISGMSGYSTCMAEVYNYTPSLDQIQSTICNYYNEKTNEEITLGYEFTTISGIVLRPYLSLENQINYKNARDLEIQPYRIKNSNGNTPAYYDMYKDEMKQFYQGMIEYIVAKQQACWTVKDSIDWDEYVWEEEEEKANPHIIVEDTSVYVEDPTATGATINEEITYQSNETIQA